ncbi:PREDICTED: uncharacterized protein LOC105129154 [Populus euphratica]|uniref:Uncharacterized protein LOC105129154 n=1 Tax=Populus euphratica TaxID=75702 RepID=A0AAJ6UGD4_POPEU|nr:PREDICTED: uncharacterized protein LOC105129154 [Populus euphratica]
MLSLKMALISTGVLSLAVILKLPVLVTDFAVSELPIMYSSVISWLQPPYLFFVINCIIISILASSKLQLQKPNQEQQVPLPPADTIVPPVQVTEEEEDISVRVRSAAYANEAVVASDRYGDYEYLDVEDKTVIVEDCAVKSGDVYEREVNKAAPYRSDSIEFLIEKDQNEEKPLVSARLGRRKSLKASPEGGGKAAALRVSKPKRHDTLETTWKTITDGRPMPLARHLQKSDAWDSHVRRENAPSPKRMTMKKYEAFNDSISGRSEKLSRSPHGSGKLRKEPSPSQDELNRRVEAFINKFNEEMRLQRQRSLDQYQQMIGRGAY